MARTEIPITEVVRAGVEQPTQVSSDMTNGMFFSPNDGTIFLEVENTDSIDHDFDVVASPTYTADGLVVSNLALTVPAGEVWEFGPFKVATFRQNIDGDVFINPDVNTMLKFRATQRTPA
jgi:hypothetical protein